MAAFCASWAANRGNGHNEAEPNQGYTSEDEFEAPMALGQHPFFEVALLYIQGTRRLIPFDEFKARRAALNDQQKDALFYMFHHLLAGQRPSLEDAEDAEVDAEALTSDVASEYCQVQTRSSEGHHPLVSSRIHLWAFGNHVWLSMRKHLLVSRNLFA